MYPPNGIRVNSHPVSAEPVDQQKSIKGRIWTKMVNLTDKSIALGALIVKWIKWFGSVVGTVFENMLPSKRWSHEIYSFKKEVPQDVDELFSSDDTTKTNLTHTLTLGAMPALFSAKPNTKYISMLEPYETFFIRKGVLNNTSSVPTPDFVKVPKETIEEAVKKVRYELQKGNVYLHCKAGYGRSAVVAVCYMMSLLKDERDQDGKFKYRVDRKTIDPSNLDYNKVYDTEKLYKAAYNYVKEKRPQIYTKTRDAQAIEWFRAYENEVKD
jgi:protein-tyrosine phosphatase